MTTNAHLITTLRHEWVNLPRNRELLQVMRENADLLWVPRDASQPLGPDNRGEQKLILVTGATGAGKSKTVEKCLNSLLPDLHDPAGMPTRWVSVTTPSPFSAKELARKTLGTLDIELAKGSGRMTEAELWEAVAANFAGHRVTMFHIDEFQRLMTNKAVGRAEAKRVVDRIADTLNEIMMAHTWPVSIVVSGMPELLPLWQTHSFKQIRRRTRFIDFPQLSARYHEGLIVALKRYAELAEIALDVDVSELPGRIAMASENTFGIALEFMQEVVVDTVRDGSRKLTMKHFAKRFALRNSGEDNVFIEKNWTKIGARASLSLEDAMDAFYDNGSGK